MKLISKALLTAGAVAAASALSSCSLLDFFKDGDSVYEYIAVQEEEDGDWSFVNSKGEVILKDEFKNAPSAVVNGYFSVEENDGYTLYKFDEKKPVAVKDCENLKAVGAFSDGVCPIVKPKQRVQLVNGDGEVKATLEPVKGKEITGASNRFFDGMLLVETEDSHYGAVDTKGQVVIEPKYDGMSFWKSDIILAAKKIGKDDENEFKVVALNKKGDVVFEIKKGQRIVSVGYNAEYIFTRDDDRFYAYDDKGESIKLSSKIKDLRVGEGKFFAYEDDGQWGVMQITDEGSDIVVRAKYERVTFYDGKILAGKEDKNYLLNDKGDEELAIDDYSYILGINNFGLFARDESEFTMLDDNGDAIKGASFSDINLSISKSSWLQSDYFNMKALADKVAEAVSSDGIRGYKLGNAASIYGDGPASDYAYRTNVNMTNLDLEGYRWSASGMAQFSESMTNWDFNSYTYESIYTWNPSSRLSNITLNINTETKLNVDDLRTLADAIAAKGYKVAEKPASGAKNGMYLLTNGNTIMVIGLDGQNFQLGMTRDEDGTVKTYFAEQIRQYNANVADNPDASCESYDTAAEYAPVDSAVAVEEVVEEASYY